MRSAAGKVLSVFDIMQRPKSGSPLALLRNVVLLCVSMRQLKKKIHNASMEGV